jgi:hypothetical protein
VDLQKMENSIIQVINSEVYKKFPEIKGESPNIKPYGANQYLLVYKAKAKTADGLTIPRTVRVVANKDGKINKISTSR